MNSKELSVVSKMQFIGSNGSTVFRQEFDVEMVDVMRGASRWEIRLAPQGFIALVDVMPRLVPANSPTTDFAVVRAARVSYGNGTTTKTGDGSLIRYMYSHEHGTPFESIELQFHCRLPIFVARQWIRHRMAEVNEMSARYSVMPSDYYYWQPEQLRVQSQINKQGSDNVSADVSFVFAPMPMPSTKKL